MSNTKLSKIKCYDNDGETLDRYTVVYLTIDEGNGLKGARAMNAHPMHPQGIGMYCSAEPGPHLGRVIEFSELPLECQKLVNKDLEDL